ncbi:MAG TPA: hypothetical protein VGD60_07155 [Candidatus Acidoferrales bacterium]
MRRSGVAILWLALAALLGSCSGSGGGGSIGGGFSNAKWAVLLLGSTFQTPISELGMNFTQNGDTISSGADSSALSVLGCDLNAATAGSTGTVKDGAFNLIFSYGSASITLVGTVAPGGQSVTGTFTSSSGGCLNGESGTFQANFVSAVTGEYAGTLTNGAVVGAPPATVAAMLSEDADFNESATITVQGNDCFSSLTTSADSLGVSIGGFTTFNATDGTNVVSFFGTVSSDASQFTGGWAVLAGCTGQSGAFQFHSSLFGTFAHGARGDSASRRPPISPELVERLREIMAARHSETPTR